MCFCFYLNGWFTNTFICLQEDTFLLKEQLRKAEEQAQATRQEVAFLAKELSDAVNVRDKTIADLHTARLENEKVKQRLADAMAELKLNAVKKDQVKQISFEKNFWISLLIEKPLTQKNELN